MRALPAVGLAAFLGAACAGSDGPRIDSFTASPVALYPGEAVTLTAVFSGGSGAIEPDLGPVASGVPLLVPPGTRPRTYLLRVSDGQRSATAVLDLPVAYRHRLEPVAGGLPRSEHAAALLEGGEVLLAAGLSGNGWQWRTELWDPATGVFRPAGELDEPRMEVVLARDAKGQLLLTGGNTGGFTSAMVHAFDAASGTWQRLRDLDRPRTHHGAVTLPGGEVLLVGGHHPEGAPGEVLGEEVYDPGAERSREPAGGGLLFPRYGHTTTPLPDGTYLIAGGRHALTDRVVPAAELFDPVTETFTPIGNMAEGRTLHVAVPLPGGRVLLAGGDTETASSTASAEVFDAAARTFAPTGAMQHGRTFHAAAALTTGQVLVAGGMEAGGELPDAVEIYDPEAGTFSASPARLPSGRIFPALVALPDGRILVHGGRPEGGVPDGYAGVYR